MARSKADVSFVTLFVALIIIGTLSAFGGYLACQANQPSLEATLKHGEQLMDKKTMPGELFDSPDTWLSHDDQRAIEWFVVRQQRIGAERKCCGTENDMPVW